MSKVTSGSCNCGSVKWKATGDMRQVIACHCSQCRKQTGLYYAATNVANDRLSVEGAEYLTWYQSSDEAKRGFCSECGSALFWKHGDKDYTSILAGSIDGESRLKTVEHIFVADKADFYELPPEASIRED